jgi:hypothetical protein
MLPLRTCCAWLLLMGLATAPVHAEWMTFIGGGTSSTGSWPATASYGGNAIVTASAFVNGNPSTPFIGLAPTTIVSPSTDYFATGLVPNLPGPTIGSISTPYNDPGDKYHVKIDFSPMFGGSTPGVFPAGSVFAINDLDISEVYLQIKATDAASNPITTAWMSAPFNWFDVDNFPWTPSGMLGSPPTMGGPVSGVYNANGIGWNFDIGMWLFTTTQDVRTIEFDMAKLNGGNGQGGAGWGFYSKPGPKIPEPGLISLLAIGLALSGTVFKRRRE